MPEHDQLLKLSEVPLKQKVRIKHINDQLLRMQLLNLGILPEMELVIERIAPLGDPLQLNINGFFLSLRREDAQKILFDSIAADHLVDK